MNPISMSSVTVITLIIVLLAALVCYAFIVQSVAQKKQQRERVIAGLRQRARNFKFMLEGAPASYLPKEVRLLVQRSLMQIYEQLGHLEPSVKTHAAELKRVGQMMAETQQAPDAKADTSKLETPQQIREIRASLEELYKFIFHLESHGKVSHQQADSYRGLIKHHVLQLTIESYVYHGRVAQEKNKLRLAIHYYDLAIKLMIKERRDGQFDNQIASLKQKVRELEKSALQSPEDRLTGIEAQDKDQISSEWEQFEEQDRSWKKKQVYD